MKNIFKLYVIGGLCFIFSAQLSGKAFLMTELAQAQAWQAYARIWAQIQARQQDQEAREALIEMREQEERVNDLVQELPQEVLERAVAEARQIVAERAQARMQQE